MSPLWRWRVKEALKAFVFAALFWLTVAFILAGIDGGL